MTSKWAWKNGCPDNTNLILPQELNEAGDHVTVVSLAPNPAGRKHRRRESRRYHQRIDAALAVWSPPLCTPLHAGQLKFGGALMPDKVAPKALEIVPIQILAEFLRMRTHPRVVSPVARLPTSVSEQLNNRFFKKSSPSLTIVCTYHDRYESKATAHLAMYSILNGLPSPIIFKRPESTHIVLLLNTCRCRLVGLRP